MSIKMKAPSGVVGTVGFQDGTSGTIDANGYVTVPANSVSALLTAGFTLIDPLGNDTLIQNNYKDMTDTAAAVIAAADMAYADATIDMAGTLTGGATLTLPTAAQLVAAIPQAYAGQTVKLRVVNSGAGAFAWTVTTATGWTLNGTMSVAQNTWRDFYVKLTNVGSGTEAATLTSRGTGTNS